MRSCPRPAARELMPLALLLALAPLGCVERKPAPGHDDVLVGRVRASASFVVPSEAVVRVLLLDIDAPDVPDYIVADEVRKLTEFPIEIEVHYDPHGLVPHITYGLAAEVLVGDTVVADCEPVPVATRGNPTEVELVLAPVTR